MTDQLQLQVNQVSFAYHRHHKVFENLDFQIRAGESVGIIGANGMGKSTLLKLLVGVLLPESGTIQVDGIQLDKTSLSEIRSRIGYVFQDSDSQLFMSRVADDVAFGPRNYGFSAEETARKVDEALTLVHGMHLKNRQSYQLSGGEKKLASIAAILALSPEILLMDEPTIALDPRNRKNLISILNQLPPTRIIASHDLDMILDTCERTILICEGKIAADGRTSEILRNEKLLKDHGLELPLRFEYFPVDEKSGL